MFLPLLLIVIAILAAAGVAYGTHPGLAQFEHGVQVILLARRAQWPLVAVSLLLCVGLMGLVISGRRRAWWLIGLAPVMTLFVHRFWSERANAPVILENPAFVDADDVTFLNDEDYVVGVSFGVMEQAYAYPYATLFRAPVVVQADHEKRMILLWSAYANRVLAFQIKGDLRARDLEVVSTPANSPLLYNSRLGQFIVAVTGCTPDGQQPGGFGKPIATTKTTWRQWRAEHPDGKVLAARLDPPAAKPASASVVGAAPGGKVEGAGAAAPRAPNRPILPAHAMYGVPQPKPGAPRLRVAVVGTTQPAAVDTDAIGRAPVNLSQKADGAPVFVYRLVPSSPPRAFVRRVGEGDMQVWPRFEPKQDPNRPEVMFRDVDTGALWTAGGLAVAGNPHFRGKRLAAVPVDDEVDWTVMKYWYPNLEIHREPEKAVTVTPPPKGPAGRSTPPTGPSGGRGNGPRKRVRSR